ncbi:MAG: hypothetical protein VYA69_01255 [Gemmatimonadota bacterium]|nr:hypothetical protein [Gemmatimonadota bacterium]
MWPERSYDRFGCGAGRPSEVRFSGCDLPPVCVELCPQSVDLANTIVSMFELKSSAPDILTVKTTGWDESELWFESVEVCFE